MENFDEELQEAAIKSEQEEIPLKTETTEENPPTEEQLTDYENYIKSYKENEENYNTSDETEEYTW